MKKLICVAALVCMFFATLWGQHDTQINSYTFNQLLFNPAYTGNHQRVEATLLQRSQFIGFKGAPVVWDLAVSTPFRLFEKQHGAAFTMNNDRVGAFNKINFAFNYAYWYNFSDVAKLGAGISLGAASYNIDPTWNDIVDDAIPIRNEASSVAFDVNVGLYYQHRDFSIGLACTHVNQPKSLIGATGEKTLTVSRTFYVSGDYHWNTSIEDVEIVPSAMLMVINITAPQLTVGSNVFYLKKYWGGLSYRIGDALGISAGMLFKSVRFGFLYEYSLSKMIGFNMGSTEIFASYLFDVNLQKKKKKYKSIRYL
jgi:type IX secretion system PorP/SprF family membrane protein